MSTGAELVEGLEAQRDTLVLAIVRHNRVIQEAEQAAIAEPSNEHWPDVIAVHREMVQEHVDEVRLLAAEIDLLLPRQRRPVD